MSVDDWNTDGEEETSKPGGIPKWVWWGCGGGCLAAFLIGVVSLMLFVGHMKRSMDPDEQWPRLAEVLPFDERPEHLELSFGQSIPFIMKQFVLTDPANSFNATVMSMPSTSAGEIDRMLEEDPVGTPLGLGEPVEPEAGELELQGRTVAYLRYRTIGGQGFAEGALGPGVRVNLSGTGSRGVMIDFRRIASDKALEDSDLIEFFSSFDVWRGR